MATLYPILQIAMVVHGGGGKHTWDVTYAEYYTFNKVRHSPRECMTIADLTPTARNRLQDHLLHNRRHHQDIHMSIPPPYLRSHFKVPSYRQRHLPLPAHSLYFACLILVLFPMLPSAGNVGQDILWQTRPTCQMLVNTDSREYTQCHPRRHGFCPASHTNHRAMERASEQKNEDQIVHRLLNGLVVMCG
jgi:hypothetical protein